MITRRQPESYITVGQNGYNHATLQQKELRRWSTLVQSLRHGRCILVLGPEVAADSSASAPGDDPQSPLPNPLIFNDALKKSLVKELKENKGDLEAADSLAGVAQQYEDGFGPSALRAQAVTYYESLRLKPSKDHEALASLPLPLIVSTSQDLLLSDVLTQAKKEHRVDRFNLRAEGSDSNDNCDFSLPTLSDPVIYHLFGTFREPKTLALSENDQLDFLTQLSARRLPSSLLRQFDAEDVSLLFVGCSIRFWYQRVLMKALIRSVSGRSRGNKVAVEPLFQTIPDPEQTILYYQRGTAVEVVEDNISNFVSVLLQKLKDAGGVSEAESGKTSRTAGPEVTAFISYARENQDVADPLSAALNAAGVTTWLDKNNLRGGENWDRRIHEVLKSVDFVLVLVTPELVNKIKGFVNVEIDAALRGAKEYRGSPFVYPLMSDRLKADQRIPELGDLQEMPLRQATFDADVAELAKQLKREFQRRIVK